MTHALTRDGLPADTSAEEHPTSTGVSRRQDRATIAAMIYAEDHQGHTPACTDTHHSPSCRTTAWGYSA
jgi:hypothetical protein